MRNLSFVFILLLLTSGAAIACDETCKKQQAMITHNIAFPSYLNAKYCADLKSEFMTIGVKSLRSYSEKRLVTKHKGGMNNTKKYLDDRKDWLSECDDYLKLTEQGRIFYDADTTDSIFFAMGSVSKDLSLMIQGVKFSNNNSLDDNSGVAYVQNKFNKLFRLVDDHFTAMQIKEQFTVKSARNG